MKLYKKVFVNLAKVLPDSIYLRMVFLSKLKRKLDLSNPRSYNEKINWLKINDRKEHYQIMVDKYEAKKYVADKIGEQYVIPVSYTHLLKAEVSDAFLCIKFWLALYVGKKIFAKIDMQKYASKIYFHVKCITILYGVLIVIDYSLHIFQATERYGLRSEQLMYTHPTVLVACCVFLIMILLSLKNYVTGSKKYIIMLLLIMCSTLRSKAFGAALAIILICYFVFVRKKKITLRTMLLFIPLVVILGWDQIQYYFFSSIIPDSARYQLLTKAFEIARDMFPLGAGFATFGSYYSGVYYSSVYAAYGLSNINGLRIGASQFISDSFWPMILGQSGYFGLFSYIFAVMMLLKAIQGIRRVENSYYAAAMSGICYLIIVSMAESAFVHPIAVPIAMMIGAFLGKCE